MTRRDFLRALGTACLIALAGGPAFFTQLRAWYLRTLRADRGRRAFVSYMDEQMQRSLARYMDEQMQRSLARVHDELSRMYHGGSQWAVWSPATETWMLPA